MASTGSSRTAVPKGAGWRVRRLLAWVGRFLLEAVIAGGAPFAAEAACLVQADRRRRATQPGEYTSTQDEYDSAQDGYAGVACPEVRSADPPPSAAEMELWFRLSAD